MFKLMESLGYTDNYKRMKIHTSKALFLENLLVEKKLPYISGLENMNKVLLFFLFNKKLIVCSVLPSPISSAKIPPNPR